MEFRILGPVEVRTPGAAPRALRRKPGQVLAVLAARCGKPVPVDRLLDLVWGDDPPPRARKSLQVHVSALRAEGVPVRHQDAGYLLAADPDQVDALRFRALAARAADVPDLAERRAAYARALDLWRGTPLAGAESEPLRAWLCAPLEAHHLAVQETAIGLDLVLGRNGEAVDALTPLVAEHPFAENLRYQLMTALLACGRRTEALAVFQDVRRTLADELGVHPNTRLRALYRDALGV
ncbi:AfsR/SARP family transcriptional regulator [Saccharothrix sp. Mg75]|uniref:AfsR/SARP family transcriptional regulator n=1 Tax=Saccharothrix sp. Mg75 TaxID=3445357 RepID=UPI003EEB27A7